MTMATYINTTSSKEYTTSYSNLIIETTTTSFIQSIWFTNYNSSLIYFSYILACSGVLIFIMNIYVLITLFKCNNLNKHLKIQYIIQISINIALGFLYDITVSLTNFIYNCLNTYLINNFVLYNIFNIDLINVYICVLHKYLISVFEFIWMWNCANFTFQRCLMISFPFYRERILKIFSWPINLVEIIIVCRIHITRQLYPLDHAGNFQGRGRRNCGSGGRRGGCRQFCFQLGDPRL